MRREQGCHGEDRGFTLIEAVVAMAVFAVTASVTLGLVLQIGQVAGGNLRRTAATNLAMRQIESARSTSAQSIRDGLQSSTETVGGITYTIQQTATYLAADGSTSVCSGSGTSLAYKLVRVSVTWPNMGSTQPVRADTLKAVGVGNGELDQSTLGTLTVLVAGASGTGQIGVTVALSPGGLSQVTGSDGCVVFAGLAPGSYTATASVAGYAGVLNTRSASAGSLGVTAATISRGILTYDTDRSVVVQLDAPGGAVLPAGMPLRLGDSYVPETTYPLCGPAPTAACTSGLPGTVQGLFPSVYAVKVGACTESTPSQVTVDLRSDPVGPPTVTVPVAAVTVDVRTGSGTSLVGRTVTATDGSGCAETYTMTTTAVGGTTMVLPYGTWTVSATVTASSSTKVTQVVTVSPSNKMPAVTLPVTS